LIRASSLSVLIFDVLTGNRVNSATTETITTWLGFGEAGVACIVEGRRGSLGSPAGTSRFES